jgi:hypothetical protein
MEIMKTGLKTILICGLLSLAVSGCKKEEYGQLIVKMTDAPGDYLEVNVDIASVQVHYDDDPAWINLSTQSGVYNLLELQNNVTMLLATGTHIPAGKVSQIRLMLGGNNTVMLSDSTLHPLKVPSAEQSGIKVNVHGIIPANHSLVITLDYNADKSVSLEGNGDYIMKPVISVLNVY